MYQTNGVYLSKMMRKSEFSVVGLADSGQRRCAIVTTPAVDVAAPRTGAPW
jgi:hypothetical protein